MTHGSRFGVRPSAIEVPVLLGTEWSMVGLHLNGTFEAWHRIKGPKRMYIGPRWDQWPFLRFQKEIVSFYDHVLKGISNGYEQLPAVRYWLHGAERWESAEDWPVPNSTKWTLRLGFSPEGEGRLSENSYHDNGTLSLAALPAGLAYPGAFDRYGPYPRTLRYESDPAQDDVHIAGPAEITLHITSTAMDTHIQVRLSDLAPDSSSSDVSVGWLLALHRVIDEARCTPTEIVHDHTRPVPVEPGRPFTARFSLFPFAQMLKKGHRLVLEIGSNPKLLAPGAKDRFVYFGSAGTPYPALNTVLHNGSPTSTLLLTIVK